MQYMPTLKVIIGIPGSGKTSYCKEVINANKTKNIVHISSDELRKELLGSEEDQTNNNFVFNVMNERALEYLKNGYDVLYDATNISRKDRKNILLRCPEYVTKEAIVCWAPIETCIERDQNRDRSVGKDVIYSMLGRFNSPYFDEGFDSIVIKKTVDKVVSRNYMNKLALSNIDQDNSHHSLSLQDHMFKAHNLVCEKTIDTEIRISSRWHDIGKLYTKTFFNTKCEKTEEAHYYGHQGFGAWIVYGLEVPFVADISWLVSTHMDPYLNTKYYRKLPEFLKNRIQLLHEVDEQAH